MSIKIGVDGCCDIGGGFDEAVRVSQIPLTVDFDGVNYTTGSELDLDVFFENMRNAKTFKTACPPVPAFLDFYEQGEEDVFIVAMSGKISATVDMARLARDMYYEKGGTKKVHVFHTLAASAKQTAVTHEIIRLYKLGKTFEEIVDGVEEFIDETEFYFLPETLDNLVKGGRASEEIAKAAAANNIRIIIYLDKEGVVTQVEKCFGHKNALRRLAETISKKKGIENGKIYISHCFAEGNAKYLAGQIQQACGCKDIVIQPSGAISSLYCGFGGVLVSF